MTTATHKLARVGAFALLMSGSAVATAVEQARGEIFDSGYLLQVFGALLFVFACLFGLMLVLKKLNGIPSQHKGMIQVMGSAKVGTREKIVLLRAGEQHLLVGVASGSVRTLHVFDGPLVEPGDGSANQGGAFADLLQASSLSGGTR